MIVRPKPRWPAYEVVPKDQSEHPLSSIISEKHEEILRLRAEISSMLKNQWEFERLKLENIRLIGEIISSKKLNKETT